MVATREGEEIWQNTGRGLVYARISAPKPNRPSATRTVRVEGGARLRITTVDRELYSESVRNPKRDVFRNGTMKRLDEPTPEKPADPEYQEEQALDEDELALVLTKSGAAFHAAVKKLDERNVMRLKAMVEDEDSSASQAQRSFVLKHAKENYISAHVPFYSRELQAEQEDGGRDL